MKTVPIIVPTINNAKIHGGGADVHARALADGIEALEDLDAARAVVVCLLCHRIPLS